MYKVIAMFYVLIFIPALSLAHGSNPPYEGQEQREIKSLSPEEINGYLAGHGMGLAKAAELNHYPGPRHVLDLSKELNLSEEQLNKTKNIFDRMQEKAIRLGNLIVEKERVLDNMFSNQDINEVKLQSLISEIEKLKGGLRFVHLKAHLEIKALLNQQQIEKYNELRGYNSSIKTEMHKHHSH